MKTPETQARIASLVEQAHAILKELGQLTGAARGDQPPIHRTAKVPGMAEAARRVGCTPGHLYRVLVGERQSPNAAKYRRTLEKVQREAGMTGGAR